MEAFYTCFCKNYKATKSIECTQMEPRRCASTQLNNKLKARFPLHIYNSGTLSRANDIADVGSSLVFRGSDDSELSASNSDKTEVVLFGPERFREELS